MTQQVCDLSPLFRSQQTNKLKKNHDRDNPGLVLVQLLLEASTLPEGLESPVLQLPGQQYPSPGARVAGLPCS